VHVEDDYDHARQRRETANGTNVQTTTQYRTHSAREPDDQLSSSSSFVSVSACLDRLAGIIDLGLRHEHLERRIVQSLWMVFHRRLEPRFDTC